MSPFISIIIPIYNGASTIDHCLRAAFSVNYKNFEVVVVDDCSTDNSCEIISNFPCRLVKLTEQSGASVARNTGAQNSKGELLFFIDADCLLQQNTLTKVADFFQQRKNEVVVGGTYTVEAFDTDFFSNFQSGFIHHSETKHLSRPDYIASHAMAITAKHFAASGGFPEDFMPILEDVEFSHRLKRSGFTLEIDDTILVQHIFHFSFSKSLANAFRKTKYWTMYSLGNNDMLADSGTASIELKTNVLLFGIIMFLILGSHLAQSFYFFAPIPFFLMANFLLCKRLLNIYLQSHGVSFVIKAFLYYSLIYPLPICLGAAVGLYKHYLVNPK